MCITLHYSAETPGFSYFVIGSKTGTVATAAPEITSETISKSEEKATIAGGDIIVTDDDLGEVKKMNWSWLVPVGVLILALIGLAWLYSKKK
ncbi:hypothetical protein J4437_08440 [Candidatus Woesearchaeota archaeon]|nr:hypothetical protein [Candidatus Woesearchaeota archaeon]